MARTFQLTITIGPTIQSPGDIAAALRRVAETLEGPTPRLVETQYIRDAGGKSVGVWRFA